MSVRKRRGAWEVTVNWRGHRHRQSSRHWTRAQASEVECKLLNDLHSRSIGRRDDRTFNDAVAKFVAEILPNVKDQAREKSHLRALAPFMEGRLLIEAPDVAEAAKKAWRTPTEKMPNGLAPGTVNRRLAILRWIVNLAWEKWDWLEQPIGRKVSLLSNKKQRHVYATPAQVEALARKMPRAGGYVLLAAYTGIRRGHLLRLTRADRMDGCLNLGTDSKTGQPQLVPLHPKVKALAARLPLCSNDVLDDEWDTARQALGLRELRFHDLRHTCASWLLQSGSSLKHVADLLGHSDMRMAQRYAHLQVEDLRKAVNRMPQNSHRKKRRR